MLRGGVFRAPRLGRIDCVGQNLTTKRHEIHDGREVVWPPLQTKQKQSTFLWPGMGEEGGDPAPQINAGALSVGV